jgi:hypothetical protein
MRYLLAALGGRDAPLRSIRSSPEKIAIISLDLTQRWQSCERLRHRDVRCAGRKIETVGGQNVPAIGTLLRFDTPLFFLDTVAGQNPDSRPIDAGEPAEPQRRQRKHGSFHHPGVPF